MFSSEYHAGKGGTAVKLPPLLSITTDIFLGFFLPHEHSGYQTLVG